MQKQSFTNVLKNRCSLKFRKIHRKTPVLESLFNKVTTLLKRDSSTGVSCEFCVSLRSNCFWRCHAEFVVVIYPAAITLKFKEHLEIRGYCLNMFADKAKIEKIDWSNNCDEFFYRELVKSVLTILKRNISPAKLEIRTFKMADVTISEDRLKTLMKEIFKGEFEKQQKNLLNLISGNFDITMAEIKKVQSDINELKASLDHTETVLEEKVAKAEKK